MIVQVIRADGDDEAPAVTVTHAQLAAMLRALAAAAAAYFPCLRRSNVDASVARRAAGLEAFVSFGRSDPAARGALLAGLRALLATLAARHGRLLRAVSGAARRFGRCSAV
jgi:hypothetical protein